jgi:hypothetical protein
VLVSVVARADTVAGTSVLQNGELLSRLLAGLGMEEREGMCVYVCACERVCVCVCVRLTHKVTHPLADSLLAGLVSTTLQVGGKPVFGSAVGHGSVVGQPQVCLHVYVCMCVCVPCLGLDMMMPAHGLFVEDCRRSVG